MLVLTRKSNQSIIIRDDRNNKLIIMVINKSNGGIRIGIDAPQNFSIVRAEMDDGDIDGNNELEKMNKLENSLISYVDQYHLREKKLNEYEKGVLFAYSVILEQVKKLKMEDINMEL